MHLRDRPSPTHVPRPSPGRIDMLLLHYTVMPSAAARQGRPGDVRAAQRSLARIGYDARASGRLDRATQAIIAAFQRHWRRASCTGILDAETTQRIAVLAKSAALPP